MSVTNEDEERELAKVFEGVNLGSDSDDKNIFKSGILPPQLANLECPFTWKYNIVSDTRDIVDRIEEKLSEIHDEDEELLPWKLFVLNLILCYEYAKNGYLYDSHEKQIECDKILDNNCNAKDKSSVLVIGCGLRHISLACKCFLLYVSNSSNEMEKILDMIVPFKDMKARDKASILCMKGAYCSEFGYKGTKESVTIIEKAVTMDKECAEWEFLLGRSLGRLRRLEKGCAIPDRKEIESLEHAVKLSDNVAFKVLLAQTYRETAQRVFTEKKRELDTFKPYCDSLNEKSLELYRQVLELKRNNVYVLVRCAQGFMKLVKPWRDLDVAKTCILKALEIAPRNPMANHVAGSYYSLVKDYEQSMLYLSKASSFGVYGAEMQLISLKKTRNKSYVPVADLERLLNVYKEKPHQESTLCVLGGYHYSVKKDFKKALEYWIKVIDVDIKSEKLRHHYDWSTNMVININKIVVREIMTLLDAGNTSETEIKTYEKIIDKYIKNHPGLVKSIMDINVSVYKDNNFDYSSWKNGTFMKSGSSSERSGKREDNSRRKDSESHSSKSQVKPINPPKKFSDNEFQIHTSSSSRMSTHNKNWNSPVYEKTSSNCDSQRTNSHHSSIRACRNAEIPTSTRTRGRGRGKFPSAKGRGNTGAVRKNLMSDKVFN